MESRNVKTAKTRAEAKNRFRIEKLERRIAPKSLLHVNGHVGGGGGAHVHIKL
jgi:hypothetical protein